MRSEEKLMFEMYYNNTNGLEDSNGDQMYIRLANNWPTIDQDLSTSLPTPIAVEA